jgi:hypothetical protein
MRNRMLLVGMGACLALAAGAWGAEITIAGPQARSTPAGSGERSPQATIPYWQYRQEASQSRQSGAGVTSHNFRYGSELRYQPQTVDRTTFRYWLPEFHLQRFGNLRGYTHRGRFDGHRARYAPSIRYTNSFVAVRERRFGSTIRYGFDRR